jgi:outer membrane protein TolC
VIFFLSLTSICLAAVSHASAVTLDEALRMALSENLELRAEAAKVRQSEADLDRAGYEFGPKLEFTSGIGPITRAQGNATFAVEDRGRWGRVLMGKLQATQPIYTFGRKGAYERAALKGREVKIAEQKLKRDEVRFQVKEAYYGFQLANSLSDFITSGKQELEKALGNRPAESLDFKTRILLQEVRGREAEVRKGLNLARAALSLRVGKEGISAKEEWLLPKKRTLESIDQYVQLALQNRADLGQARAGVEAKRELARAEKLGAAPVLAALVSYEFADTNVRTIQPGVFAYDPYNRETFSLGIGVNWKIDSLVPFAKARKERAEADEIEARLIYGEQGVRVQVVKAHGEVEEAEAKLEAAREALNLGKQWLGRAAIGKTFGAQKGGSALTEAFLAKAQTTQKYFEAVHRHHMAWAELTKIVGSEVDPLFASIP